MSIVIACPGCGRQLRVTDALMGHKVNCPRCGATFPAVDAPPPDRPALPPPAQSFPDAPPPPAQSFPDAPPPPPQSFPDAPPSSDRPWDAPPLAPPPYPDAPGSYAPPPMERPWEAPPPYFRRDGEPHRGGLILTLGILSLVLSIMSFLAFIGLVLGILAWVMGSRDLAKIREGVMDPQGQGTTQAGYICGIIGTIISGLVSFCCIGYIMIIVFAISSAPSPGTPVPMRPVPAAPKKIQLERPLLPSLVRSW